LTAVGVSSKGGEASGKEGRYRIRSRELGSNEPMALPIWMKRICARIEAGTNGYLCQIGWIETRARFRALNTENKAIPWFTYPAVSLFESRTKPEWRILEFGAGMGTIWWSEAVNHVVSLEHDAEWLEYISKNCAAEVLKTSAASSTDYIDPALNTGHYDVIIVDGLFREECLSVAPGMLTDNGIIILDDAQRFEYKAAIETLLAQEFRVLELHGPQPVSKHPGCTAIFYRDRNVLEI
jgi:precorrin-6B methylase 2